MPSRRILGEAMTEPDTTPYEEFSERLRLNALERDAAIDAVDSRYARAVASGAPGDLYAPYLAERASVINASRMDAYAMGREYTLRAPASAPPLPALPGPGAAYPQPQRHDGPRLAAPGPLPLQTPVAPITASPRQQGRGSSPRWRLVGGILAAGTVVLVAGGMISSSAGGVRSSGTGTSLSGSSGSGSYTSTDREVLYEVEGTATSVDITMETPSGTSQGSNKKVPLASKDSGKRGISLTMERGDFVYISAQNQGSSGTVTCKISVDGVVISKVTSSGAYTIASCDGTVP